MSKVCLVTAIEKVQEAHQAFESVIWLVSLPATQHGKPLNDWVIFQNVILFSNVVHH